MSDPNIVSSGLSQRIIVEGHEFQIEIYRLEGDPTWTLEVVDEDGCPYQKSHPAFGSRPWLLPGSLLWPQPECRSPPLGAVERSQWRPQRRIRRHTKVEIRRAAT